MSDLRLHESDEGFYLAKHPDYPLIGYEKTEGEAYNPEPITTEKTKQKHVDELLNQPQTLDEIVKRTGTSEQKIKESLLEAKPKTRPYSGCPYRRWIGPKVYEALGGYDHNARATMGVWLTEALFLTAIIPIIQAGIDVATGNPVNPQTMINYTLQNLKWNTLLCGLAGAAVTAGSEYEKKKNGEVSIF